MLGHIKKVRDAKPVSIQEAPDRRGGLILEPAIASGILERDELAAAGQRGPIQVGFLLKGLTPSQDGRPSVSRRCETEPRPKSGKLSNISSDASRTLPTVLKPAAARR